MSGRRAAPLWRPRMYRLVTLTLFLPASGFKNFLLRQLGHDIDREARIGCILATGVRELRAGPGSRIASFNVLHGVGFVTLASGATIGHWNWFASSEVGSQDGNSSSLTLGAGSCITSRHYVDVAGGFIVGAMATVAGVRSTFFTHQIDTAENTQGGKGIQIGEYALVSSNVKMTPGAVVPDRSVVAMGAVVVPGLTEPGRLYAGVPARSVREVDGQYFSRSTPQVSASKA